MSLKEELAASIKAQRSASGLSQDRLASKAGISTRYYQDIEAAVKQPSIEIVFKLARALECDYTVLLAPAWERWLVRREQ